MKIKRLRFTNIACIDELDISPSKKVTVISAENGSGKTKLFQAIMTLISGGHFANLIRKGEKEAQVVIEFDDPVTMSKKTTEKGYDTKVQMAGHTIDSPMKYINEVFGRGFNPVAFMNMKPADRVDAILKAIPLEIDLVKAGEISGVAGSDITRLADSINHKIRWQAHGLQVLADLRDLFFNLRTVQNNEVKASNSQIKLLEESIITSTKDYSAEIEKQKALVTAIEHGKQARIDECTQAIQTNRDDESDELQRVRDKYEALRNEIITARDNDIEQMNIDLKPVESKLTELETEQKTFEKQTQARESLEIYRQNVTDTQELADRNTETIAKIDKWKADKVSEYSIAGMAIEIQEKDLLIDGLPFDDLNKAKQIKLSVALAELGLGKARVMLIDEIESLDSKSMALLEKEADEKDIQLVCFKVSDDEMMIETSDDGDE